MNGHVLPEGWREVRLVDFAPLQRGFDLPSANLKKGKYPVVYSNGIKSYHAEFKARAPGVTTGRSGTIGQVTYVEDDYWPHNTSLWVTDFKGNYPKYVYYALQNIRFEKYNSGSGVPTLNRNDIHREIILCPTYAEQKAIAEILQTWDAAIEKTESLIAAKEKQFKGLARSLITKAQKEKSWNKISLGEAGSLYSGLLGKTKNDFGTGKPYLTYLNVYGNLQVNPKMLNYVNIKDEEQQTQIRKGDVFFTVSSETPDEVGVSSVLLEDLGECYLNSFCFGWRLSLKELLPEYLGFYFRSDSFRRQMVRAAQGATRFNLSRKYLKAAHILFPPLKKQKEIAGVLSAARCEIDILRKLVEKYRVQKKGIMQKLLTGKWRTKTKKGG